MAGADDLLRQLNSCSVALSTWADLARHAGYDELAGRLAELAASAAAAASSLRADILRSGGIPTARCSDDLMDVALGEEALRSLAAACLGRLASLAEALLGDPRISGAARAAAALAREGLRPSAP